MSVKNSKENHIFLCLFFSFFFERKKFEKKPPDNNGDYDDETLFIRKSYNYV